MTDVDNLWKCHFHLLQWWQSVVNECWVLSVIINNSQQCFGCNKVNSFW